MQTLKTHLAGMAAYSAWANRRLSQDALALPDGLADKDVGLYFKSLFATLTHLLQSDRAWMYLLRGGALQDIALAPAPDTLAAYADRRGEHDRSFREWLDRQPDDWFDLPFSFASGMQSWRGLVYRGTHASALQHVFNHQTHHRGQAHAALTILGVQEPKALDILVKGMLGE